MHMKLSTVLCGLLLAGFSLFGQNVSSICGQHPPTSQLNLIHVACIDWDKLAELGVPGVFGQSTQVLIHAKEGHAVRIELFYNYEGREVSVVLWGDLRFDAYRQLSAMVQAPGIFYTRFNITVLHNKQ